LPSESEWEFASRSRGKDIDFPWGDNTPDCLHATFLSEEFYFNDSAVVGCGTHYARSVCYADKGMTEQGICDMAGNVREWMQDYYHEKYSIAVPNDGTATLLPGKFSEYRSLRGGGYNSPWNHLYSWIRNGGYQNGTYINVGVRCAKSYH
ncbi:MAG: formylglycine-generating enzyme family protein, partial [Proteobacteria bacterium]|nr:formylglycine-generating enzyme family protein [Pseudomonadota bacterium]